MTVEGSNFFEFSMATRLLHCSLAAKRNFPLRPPSTCDPLKLFSTCDPRHYSPEEQRVLDLLLPLVQGMRPRGARPRGALPSVDSPRVLLLYSLFDPLKPLSTCDPLKPPSTCDPRHYSRSLHASLSLPLFYWPRAPRGLVPRGPMPCTTPRHEFSYLALFSSAPNHPPLATLSNPPLATLVAKPGCQYLPVVLHSRRSARVAELVDALDLGSSGVSRGGSSPPSRIQMSL